MVTTYVVRADALLSPQLRETLAEPAVVVRGGRFAWVGPAADLPSEYADAPQQRVPGVMTPGLVNAHTHLQYTGFAEVAGAAYAGFEDWSEAFEARYELVADPSEWRAAALAGARLGVAAGTTAFSDIVTDDSARGAVASVGADGIEFLEVIAELESSWHAGGRDRFLERVAAAAPAVEVGVSPHAPYSVDPEVTRELCRFARDAGLRIHSHVAESALERALYVDGEPGVLAIYGAMRAEFALVRSGGAGCGTGAFSDSIELLGSSTHVAHGIYFDQDERALLRRRETSVVLCPRSNAVIGLDEAPVAAYLREGNRLAIGTDSLASSPSLDVFADAAAAVRIARRQGYRDPDLLWRVFEAATLGGAVALGHGGPAGYGAIAVGRAANFAVFRAEPGHAPLAQLLEEDQHDCVLTVIRGESVHADAATGASRPTASGG